MKKHEEKLRSVFKNMFSLIEWKRLRLRMIRNTLIVLIPSIILAFVTFNK